jgi:Secretion system C-terminal sorting domain
MKHSIHPILLGLILPAWLPFMVRAQGMRLTEGVHLVVQGSPALVFDNAGIINNGSIMSDSGTVIFTGDGSAGKTFIGGDQPVSFYNLRIDKSFNDVELDNDILVNGTVQMNQGILQLNNHLLDLGSTGMINGENNNSFITGTHGGMIRIAAMLNAPQGMNPGNIGVELTSPANLGLTTISRGHVQQVGNYGETSVQRYFEISPELNTGLDASLRFNYLEGELAGNKPDELSLFTSSENENRWSAMLNKNINRGDYSVTEDHLDQLHRYTLAVGKARVPGDVNMGSSVHVFPNPTVNEFTVTIFSKSEKTETIQLYDPLGHLLEQKDLHCRLGVNTVEWNIGKYATGVYLIRFSDPAFRNLQIMKQ